MLQNDGFKLKVENVVQISHKYLKAHPTIKNRYKLDVPEGENRDRKYFGDNIDIYYNNGTLFLNGSLPYLRHGHNFIEFDPVAAEITFKDLSEMLEVDLFKGRLMQREFAILQRSKIPFKYLRKLIGGVDGMELQKKTPHLLMFGKTNLQCKIYEVKPNLMKKVGPAVRNTLCWTELEDIVKVELKFYKSSSLNLLDYLEREVHEDHRLLVNFMDNDVELCPVDYEAKSFSDILFQTLLSISWNYCSYDLVHNQILEHIEMADLTPSQKYARRKMLKQKQLNIHSSENTVFSDLLEVPVDYRPF